MYGGKGGTRSAEPTQSTLVTVTYTDDGVYVLWDPATATYAAIKLATKIWWAHLPEGAIAQAASSSDRRDAAELSSR
ncbi:hypothetical protein ACIBBE_24090 [Streptomyces sp. NPDC051644]|uniref:hypothetical protein n=1 Tax=Streptomyces sp. NPDC051644 TaxID=3365666 RepID=UPI0037A20B6B